MEYKIQPWKHQKEIIDKVIAEDIHYYALFHDLGTGKTKTAIEILRAKFQKHGRALKTLIIGPSAVQENWKREIMLHSHIPENMIQVVDGTTRPNGTKLKNPQKKLKLEQIGDALKEIFVITTATVGGKDTWDAIEKLGIELLIVDEVHNFKDPTGKRSKALQKLSRGVKYKFILTGSPVLQNAMDLWSQFYILDPSILGDNFYQFRAQYFYDANADMPSHIHFPNWIPKDKKYFKKMREAGLPEEALAMMTTMNLNQTIYQHADRRMKDEVLDLPPRTTTTLEVEMSKEHRKMYESFRDELVAILEEPEEKLRKKLEQILATDGELGDLIPNVMSADLAIVKTLRLMQLAAGIFTNDETGGVTLIKTEKLDVLKADVESICSNKLNKIIIWTVFTPTYEQIASLCSDLGVKAVFLNGQQDKDEKQAAMDAFQNDPEVQVIIANPAAGGTGVNLTAANYEYDYSFSFKLGDWLQKNARAYRGGQKRRTHAISLVTKDTIEEKCLEKLKEKEEHAEDILAVKEFKRGEILGMI